MLTGWHLFWLSSIPLKSFESIGHWSEIRKWWTIDGDQGTHFSVVMLNYVHSSGELRKNTPTAMTTAQIQEVFALPLSIQPYFILFLFLSFLLVALPCTCLSPSLWFCELLSDFSFLLCCLLFFYQWYCKYKVIFISLFIPFSLGVILGVLCTI